MREKIGKALRTRAEAIKRALEEYNRCAAALQPPRDEITWTKIVDTVFLAELDILKDARQDIRQLKWADPAHREAALLHFNILRAQEEIRRLNVEIRRLLTAMYDEHVDYMRAIKATKDDKPLSAELHRLWTVRDRLNTVVAGRLVDTSRLKGFTGKLATGHRIGRSAGLPDGSPHPSWALLVTDRGNRARARYDEGDSEESDEDDGSDEESEMVEQLANFVGGMDGPVDEPVAD